ncbi:PREDICTED: N-acetylated-alpha-linked acidic dipeptidase 2-like isoform X2 [Priapulus caudatus]|uniref:N-acetylated-alpha-linked acidic dipeptidase 2-like isoform X2 n=1 Tax=Priapulus caudatus TaxID=37621 RepID=A0ABM1EQ73_PRICU|nr:PREDICTED: N-acetylated-alpha-linked acidic dipeptidase 2-like isoform X2 [Priapulus caudatus]
MAEERSMLYLEEVRNDDADTGDWDPSMFNTLPSQARRPRAVPLGLCLLSVIVALVVGVIIGYFAHPLVNTSTKPVNIELAVQHSTVLDSKTTSTQEQSTLCSSVSTVRSPSTSTLPDSFLRATSDGDPSISEKIITQIDPENIRTYLRYFTSTSHLAGDEQDRIQAEYVKKLWQDQGLDSVDLQSYDVLLSYPDVNSPNTVSLLDDKGTAVYTTDVQEKPLTDDQADADNIIPPFHAYSASGTPTGVLVYVNYGRVEDFNYLTRNKSMNLTNAIMLCRYGKVFRGEKIVNAQAHGAAGVIIFSDPSDYAMDGTEPENVYPNTWWLPPTGVQRGTLKLSSPPGDPLTPSYPATEHAYRVNPKDTDLPKIPSHPISYGGAYHFLKELSGESAPEDWQGGLNLTYNLGGEFIKPGWAVRMNVSTTNQRRKTYNVIGTIEGEVEPDRYVLVGNHRDAWVFGAVDPSSGTAAMLELTRVFGKLKKEGWKPRRSLVFCSWAAEEHGLIGSTEWVEDKLKSLVNRALVYLNVDIAVQGNFSIRALGTPTMYQSLFDAAKKVPNPNSTSVAEASTLYDQWVRCFPDNVTADPDDTQPEVMAMGTGSDFYALAFSAGVPSCDLMFEHDFSTPLSSYPLYHSAYETFFLMDKLMDPTFEYHAAVTKMWGEMARNHADSILVPIDLSYYGTSLVDSVAKLQKDYKQLFIDSGVTFAASLDVLETEVKSFQKRIKQFMQEANEVDHTNTLAVRAVNDQLMLLERAFLDSYGLPGRPLDKHIIYGASSQDNYSGMAFPGLFDLLFEIDREPNPAERWDKVDKHLSVLVYTIHAATATLSSAI